MGLKFKRLCLFIMAAISLPVVAVAAGPSTHFEMTDRAVQKLVTPELKALLLANRKALMCGVSFPDFGTAIDYGTLHRTKLKYGSVAHGPEFVEAYFQRVMSECGPSYANCDPLISHFMGVAAHGMEDDLYDELFMNKAEALDPAGDRVNHDLWADEIFIVKYDFFDVSPRYYLPVTDLIEVYKSMGLEVSPKELREGKFYHHVGTASLRAIAPIPYPIYARRMSFTRDNIITHEGGVEYTSTVIARFWESIWKRLHKGGQWDGMVLETWPHPGAAGFETDSQSLYSRVAAYFFTGMDKASITSDSFYLEGPDGRVPCEIRVKREKDNFAALIPQQNLKPGATYTAVIAAELKDMEGNPMGQDYSWSFTTKANAAGQEMSN